MKLSALVAVSAAVAFSSSMASAAIVTYSFTGATDGSPTTSSGVTNFTPGNFSTGNQNGTVATPINSTSASSGYTGASGGNNIGVAARTGVLDTTGGSGSAYVEVTFTPASGFSISLSDFDFGARSTSTGAQAYTLLSSIDSFSTASPITTGTIANTSSYSFKDNTFSAVTGAVDAPVTFRLYLSGGTGTPTTGTINTRLDDITIGVSAVSAAVPEPTTLGLAAAGLTLVLRRRTAR